MTSHADSIKQLTDALNVAKYTFGCLKERGLTHYHVCYAPKGALALIDEAKVFGLQMSDHEAKVHKKLCASYLNYSRTWSRSPNDPLREYNLLGLIREGFAKECKCPETLASLNKMLTDIHAFWITEYEAFITAKEEELSHMM